VGQATELTVQPACKECSVVHDAPVRAAAVCRLRAPAATAAAVNCRPPASSGHASASDWSSTPLLRRHRAVWRWQPTRNLVCSGT
jgi:hypothetical protein